MREDCGLADDPLFRTIRRNIAKYTSFVMLARDLMVPHPYADPEQLIIRRPIFVDQTTFTKVRTIYETLFNLHWPYTKPKSPEPFDVRRVWKLIKEIPQLHRCQGDFATRRALCGRRRQLCGPGTSGRR
jgi:hypothetical protein